MRENQLRQVDCLEGEINTEPLQVPQCSNPQVTNSYELEVVATDARRGADRRVLDARAGTTEGVDVLILQLQGQGCKLSCSCVCHTHYRLQSPLFMDGLLGSLCIRYSGYPTAKLQCNEYYCSKQSHFRAILVYSFPQWLLGASPRFFTS